MLCAFLLYSFIQVSGQKKPDEIRVTQQYHDKTLAFIYRDLSEKYNFRIVYDTVIARTIYAGFIFTNNSLINVIKATVDGTRLKFYLSSDSSEIYVLAKEKKYVPVTIPEIKYTGKPEKFKFNLTGKVVDRRSGEPLPFAYITFNKQKSGTTSNVDGYFTLLNVPDDTTRIIVQYLGFKKKEFSLTPATPIKNLIVELDPDYQNLGEVVVKGEKQEIMAMAEKSSMVKLTPQKLANLPSLGEKDILRTFQLMPGIGGSNESSSGLYVKGGSPDQNLVLYDGITVYHVDHLFGFYSAFNSNAIKDVQLYKGGFESKFGGRISSVTEITGKEGNKKRLSGGGDLSLLSANIYVESPINDKITFLIAARRSYKGLIYNKVFDLFNKSNPQNSSGRQMPMGMGNQNSTTVSSYFYDLNGKISWNPNKRDVFSLSFYNGTDKLDNSRIMQMPSFRQVSGSDFSNSIVDLTKWGNTGGSMKWSRNWGERIYSNSLISYSNYFSTRDRSTDGKLSVPDGPTRIMRNGLMENNDLKDLSFKTDFEWKVSANNQLEFGSNITRYRIVYSFGMTDTSKIVDKDNVGSTYALYIQDKISLFNNIVQILPGVRSTYFPGTGKNYLEPRISGSANISGNLTLKAAWGVYNQFAKRVIREDIMSGSRDFWVLADNETIPVSSSIHYLAGISYQTKNFLFEVEGYYKSLDGLSEYSMKTTPTPGKIEYEEKFSHGTGSSRGLDFLAQKKYGTYTGWVCYSIGQVLHKFPENYDYVFYASYDVTHEFKTVNQISLGKNWNLSATWIIATGKPYTAPQGGYLIQLLDGTYKDFVTISARNGQRLPAYHRLDISANFTWKGNINKYQENSISLSMFNLYNRQNTWYKEYEIIDNQIITTNVNYLGLTPNLTFSVKF